MPFREELTLLLVCVATGLLLHLVPYDGEKVALYRLQEKLRQEPELTESLTTQCSSLESADNHTASRFFLKNFRLPSPASTARSKCLVLLESTQTQRFFVRNYAHFALAVQDDTGAFVYRRGYDIEFPRPLALLPLAAFLLSLVWGFKPWGLAWTLGTYLLFLGGGNLIRALEFGVKSTLLTFGGSQPLLGTLLVLLWVSLHRSRKDRKPTRHFSPTVEGWLNRVLSVLAGFWNPAVFTAAAKLFLPFRGSLSRITSFLDAQFFIVCGSLYLLAVDWGNPRSLIVDSLLLPRYFSFAGALFLSLGYWSGTPKKRAIAWHQLRLWRAVGFVAAVQLLTLRLPWLRDISTVTRVGIALILSELVSPKSIAWRSALKGFLPWAGMLLVATFITLQSVQSGVSDLILVLWEPGAHPTAVALFTFLSGVVLGFVTGNFAITFFALYGVLVRSFDQPLVKAALIDGILAGSLLSPFSLFNLFPAAQFGLDLQELVRFRFRQLAVPLTIATIIYAVCAINSVAILQPVTFVFLCLVALAARLKKNAWVWRGFAPKGA
jgi:hypothetical protein